MANKLLGMIRSFWALVDTSFTLLYKTIVRPHLEYAATVWNPNKKHYFDDVAKVQHSATELLQNMSHFSYPDCLAAHNLPTLVCRRMRVDVIKTFMILNIIYDSS